MGSGHRFAAELIPITAKVIGPPLTVEAGTLDFSGLRAGQTYVAVADMNSQLLPSSFGESMALKETIISGDYNSNVLVTFFLPTRLYSYSGNSTSGYIDIDYNSLSASWGASGAEDHYMDPRTPATISLDSQGTASLVLGCIIRVPSTAQPDTYYGDAVIAVQYTGL